METKTNKVQNNTLVFPLKDPASKAEAQNRGISLLDYFIAHAPAEQQWKFDVPMETEKPKPIKKLENAAPLAQLITTNANEIDKWNDIYKKKKAQMWASEWAKVQLEQRLKYL